VNDSTVDRPVAIRMSGIVRDFGKQRAVDDLDLVVHEGELFSLLGPNGAGKTTTIKMLCCLLGPTAGEAQVMGHDVVGDPLGVKRMIGVSPQETALAENLNAWENLSLIGGSHGLDRDTIRRKSEELLELMDLTGRARERVKRYSGGMKRRLSIALALVADPEVLFLDEPTLGLDPQARAGVWKHIERFKGVKTVVLTTHYLEEADALADRIAIMDAGRIVAQGTSRELKDGIAAGQTMRIEADDLGADVVAGLRELYGEVTLVEGGVEIGGGNLGPYEIQDVLRPRGVAVRSIHLKETSLDEVFLHHTGRELRE